MFGCDFVSAAHVERAVTGSFAPDHAIAAENPDCQAQTLTPENVAADADDAVFDCDDEIATDYCHGDAIEAAFFADFDAFYCVRPFVDWPPDLWPSND